MDGLGYWIFLAVMYLLSAFMKKRQQQETDVEDSDTQPKKNPNPFQAEFLQNLFGDMKDIVLEPELENDEEIADFELEEIGLEQSSEPNPNPVHEEQDHVVFEDLSNLDAVHKKLQFWNETDKRKQSFRPQFINMDDVKRAIVLKEILDKPRALRKRIR